MTRLFKRQFCLRIPGTESVQIVVQIPPSVGGGGAIGVLLKVQLATEGDRPAAVIGDEAYSSDERGGGILVGGAGRENIGESGTTPDPTAGLEIGSGAITKAPVWGFVSAGCLSLAEGFALAS